MDDQIKDEAKIYQVEPEKSKIGLVLKYALAGIAILAVVFFVVYISHSRGKELLATVEPKGNQQVAQTEEMEISKPEPTPEPSNKNDEECEEAVKGILPTTMSEKFIRDYVVLFTQRSNNGIPLHESVSGLNGLLMSIPGESKYGLAWRVLDKWKLDGGVIDQPKHRSATEERTCSKICKRCNLRIKCELSAH